ncbi:hypothetical protein ACJJTC_010156 [Scirpophaga incertulas]
MGALGSKIFGSSVKMVNVEIQNFIKDTVAKEKVVIFSKSYCPYCTMAKEVFTAINHPATIIELDERKDGNEIQNELSQITGFRTVPQVFVNGSCVGGGTDVKKLQNQDSLPPCLLAKKYEVTIHMTMTRLQ